MESKVDEDVAASVADCKIEPSEPVLTEEEVVEVLRKRIKSNEFRLVEHKVSVVNKMNGYLGLYYNLTAAVRMNGDRRTSEYKFFVKTRPPLDSPQYVFMVESGAFLKEVKVYTDLIPRMEELGDEVRHFGWAPRCYFSKENEVIVLDDLSTLGYVMPNKFKNFDYDHYALLLKMLAKFHSRSIILENNLKSTGKKIVDVYGDILEESMIGDSGILKKASRAAHLGVYAMIELMGGLDDEEKIHLKNRLATWYENLTAALSRSTKNYGKVVCHRDLWANNLMVKYDAEGKPVDCCMIDFQFVVYNPPAIDIMLLLYWTTNRETRTSHGESFFQIYYEKLREELENNGLDVNDHLGWSELLKSCEDAKLIAIVFATTDLPSMLMESDTLNEQLGDTSKLLEHTTGFYNDTSAIFSHQFVNVPSYRERITEILMEAYETLPAFEPEKL
ncbi:uncharacterized protein LOC105690371 [Athalia rosae]|uniref:uncharacterized protein LOC105690371 n=1 Tax=Athalia rosae TaxID=37344 RepID=UPI002033C37C|nr:uncharacterized protein LOC105690371 [Athalia rosae]